LARSSANAILFKCFFAIVTPSKTQLQALDDRPSNLSVLMRTWVAAQ
jgi:hypothetical protein